MIKFFRKIRQKLLSENKFTKYLVYAIGEILLVVFGILIALNINNWNEDRKNTRQEIKILKEVKSDLRANIEEAVYSREALIQYNKMTDSIADLLDNGFNLTIIPRVALAGSVGSFNQTATTYKFIESNGINFLSNDSLRISISQTYEIIINDFVESSIAHNRIIEQYIEPYLMVHFKYIKNEGKSILISIDSEKTSRDQQFRNLVFRANNLQNHRLKFLTNGLSKIESLITEIDDEISRLEN